MRKLYLFSLRGLTFLAAGFLAYAAIRYGGVHFAGQFAWQAATWAVVRSVGPVGVDFLLLREISLLIAQDMRAEASAFLRMSLIRVALTSVLFSLLVFGLSFQIGNLRFEDSFLAALAAAPLPVIGTLVSVLRTTKFVLFSQSLDALLLSVVPYSTSAFLLLFVSTSISATLLVFFGSALACLIALLSITHKSLNLTKTKTKSTIKIWLKSWRLGMSQAQVALNTRLPIIAGATIVPSSALAYFDLGLKVQLFGATIAWLGGTLHSPSYALAHDQGSPNGEILLRRESKLALFLVTAASIVIVGIHGVLGELLQVPGSALLWVFLIIGLGTIFEVPVNSSGYFMVMSHKERFVSKMASLNLATIIICLSLLPWVFIGHVLLVLPVTFLCSSLVRFLYLYVLVGRGVLPNPLWGAAK